MKFFVVEGKSLSFTLTSSANTDTQVTFKSNGATIGALTVAAASFRSAGQDPKTKKEVFSAKYSWTAPILAPSIAQLAVTMEHDKQAKGAKPTDIVVYRDTLVLQTVASGSVTPPPNVAGVRCRVMVEADPDWLSYTRQGPPGALVKDTGPDGTATFTGLPYGAIKAVTLAPATLDGDWTRTPKKWTGSVIDGYRVEMVYPPALADDAAPAHKQWVNLDATAALALNDPLAGTGESYGSKLAVKVRLAGGRQTAGQPIWLCAVFGNGNSTRTGLPRPAVKGTAEAKPAKLNEPLVERAVTDATGTATFEVELGAAGGDDVALYAAGHATVSPQNFDVKTRVKTWRRFEIHLVKLKTDDEGKEAKLRTSNPPSIIDAEVRSFCAAELAKAFIEVKWVDDTGPVTVDPKDLEFVTGDEAEILKLDPARVHTIWANPDGLQTPGKKHRANIDTTRFAPPRMHFFVVDRMVGRKAVQFTLTLDTAEKVRAGATLTLKEGYFLPKDIDPSKSVMLEWKPGQPSYWQAGDGAKHPIVSPGDPVIPAAPPADGVRAAAPGGAPAAPPSSGVRTAPSNAAPMQATPPQPPAQPAAAPPVAPGPISPQPPAAPPISPAATSAQPAAPPSEPGPAAQHPPTQTTATPSTAPTPASAQPAGPASEPAPAAQHPPSQPAASPPVAPGPISPQPPAAPPTSPAATSAQPAAPPSEPGPAAQHPPTQTTATPSTAPTPASAQPAGPASEPAPAAQHPPSQPAASPPVAPGPISPQPAAAPPTSPAAAAPSSEPAPAAQHPPSQPAAAPPVAPGPISPQPPAAPPTAPAGTSAQPAAPPSEPGPAAQHPPTQTTATPSTAPTPASAQPAGPASEPAPAAQHPPSQPAASPPVAPGPISPQPPAAPPTSPAATSAQPAAPPSEPAAPPFPAPTHAATPAEPAAPPAAPAAPAVDPLRGVFSIVEGTSNQKALIKIPLDALPPEGPVKIFAKVQTYTGSVGDAASQFLSITTSTRPAGAEPIAKRRARLSYTILHEVGHALKLVPMEPKASGVGHEEHNPNHYVRSVRDGNHCASGIPASEKGKPEAERPWNAAGSTLCGSCALYSPIHAGTPFESVSKYCEACLSYLRGANLGLLQEGQRTTSDFPGVSNGVKY